MMPSTRKHSGLAAHPLRNTWHLMMRRCYVETDNDYPTYGGRGITVDERWHDLKNFVSDMHPKPEKSMQIDRIDNDKGYGPDNCRWATPEQNTKNRRNSFIIPYKGKMMNIVDIAKDIGIGWNTLAQRFRSGVGDPYRPADKSRQKSGRSKSEKKLVALLQPQGQADTSGLPG